ncbi:MAG TPA: hypothetical protein DC049_11125, partial [Spirochaetia bacterium]|nr:hypothetical protein [Spirochaetia bacterium]
MPDKKIFLPQDIPYKDLNHPPSICSILGVPYAHFSWTNGSELFLTEYGLFRINELHPDNFVSD